MMKKTFMTLAGGCALALGACDRAEPEKSAAQIDALYQQAVRESAGESFGGGVEGWIAICEQDRPAVYYAGFAVSAADTQKQGGPAAFLSGLGLKQNTALDVFSKAIYQGKGIEEARRRAVVAFREKHNVSARVTLENRTPANASGPCSTQTSFSFPLSPDL